MTLSTQEFKQVRATFPDYPARLENDKTVTFYRQGQPETVLRYGDALAIPELLPRWELPIAELWKT